MKLAVAWAVPAPTTTADMHQPNIVHILIDDLGGRDLGCYGSSFYETPHLDGLAATGLRFTDAYASCPVCSPTRASIMTGRYPARVGITQFIGGQAEGRLTDVPYLYFLSRSELSLAAALRAGGYATWHVGKWHLGGNRWEPQHHGFEVNVGGCQWGSPRGGYFAPWSMPHLDEGVAGDYLTDRLTDEAIRLIQGRDRSRPFFLDLSHYAVHTPIQAPPALVAKYEAKAKARGLDRAVTFVDGDEFPCLHKWGERIRRRIIQSDPAYAAMMENLDTNIGRLLAVLDAEGIAGDTLVTFTSDNGGLSTSEGSPTCNLPLAEGKGWMQEGGLRVCQLMRWPGVTTPGRTVEVPVTSTDYYPTYLAAAGLAPLPEQHCDGVDLMPLLCGGTRLDREAIYWHYPHYGNQGDTPAGAIRAGDWKLVERFEGGVRTLFDLRADPGEQHDLAAAEPERVRRLHGRLCDWRASVAAAMPRPNPRYEDLRREFESRGQPA
jgi:arylsulfatase A-like enzyme